MKGKRRGVDLEGLDGVMTLFEGDLWTRIIVVVVQFGDYFEE